MIFFILSLNEASAALSATTANTIQGSKPFLKLSDGTPLTNLNQLLGFSMPKRDGSSGREQIDASMSASAIIAPAGMKYQDVIALVVADANSHNITLLNVDDFDGDASYAGSSTVSGSMTATWYEGVIQVTNLNQTLSACGGPYSLKIAANNVIANTTYGDPRVNNYGSHSGVTYTFTANSPGICYIQPNSMTVHSGKTAAESQFPTTGYNPLVWEAGKGFSVSKMIALGKKFPTTGFYKAAFSLIGSGNDQSKYKCTKALGETRISLSGTASTTLGEDCKVTYETLTKTDFISGGTMPTINLEYAADGINYVLVDSFTIPTPNLWARPVGQVIYNTFDHFTGTYSAAIACGAPAGLSGSANFTQAASYFFNRNEFTNTPYANPSTFPPGAGNAMYIGGYFSRDLDGTFMGEWGRIYDDYPNSKWVGNNNSWTGELYSQTSTSVMYAISKSGGTNSGHIGRTDYLAVCRN